MTGAPNIDARGLLCPLPVLRLRKALNAAAPGTAVTMIATDPMARVDVPHFCQQTGHAMMRMRDLGDGAHEYTVIKGSDATMADDDLRRDDS